MRAIYRWVFSHGSHLLFLYGQDDPWSAQRFALGAGTSDSAIYIIKGGSHLTPYTDLPSAQAKVIIETLRRWAGLPASGGIQAVQLAFSHRSNQARVRRSESR
jgi:hypothetical protein